MEKASKVMYSIANIFNWFFAILALVSIVISSLALAHVLPADMDTSGIGVPTLVWSIFAFILAIIVIFMVRRAKKAGTSRAWDIFFLVVGILQLNPFYVLGGIFGIVARR